MRRVTTTDEPAVEDGSPDLPTTPMLDAALEALLLVVDAPSPRTTPSPPRWTSPSPGSAPR